MKLIIEKRHITTSSWRYHGERDVAVKITKKRITITDGINTGLRFDLDGRCISRLGPGPMYRYRLERAAANV